MLGKLYYVNVDSKDVSYANSETSCQVYCVNTTTEIDRAKQHTI